MIKVYKLESFGVRAMSIASGAAKDRWLQQLMVGAGVYFFSVREDASWYCWLRYGKLSRGHFQVTLQAHWWTLVFHRIDTSHQLSRLLSLIHPCGGFSGRTSFCVGSICCASYGATHPEVHVAPADLPHPDKTYRCNHVRYLASRELLFMQLVFSRK